MFTGTKTINLVCTCFGDEDSTLVYNLNATPPYIVYTASAIDQYTISFNVDTTLGGLGLANYSEGNFSMDVTKDSTVYYTPFSIVLYTCEDINCLNCTFDTAQNPNSLVNGSPNCTDCVTGYTVSSFTCVPLCGDGFVIPPETCDDHA